MTGYLQRTVFLSSPKECGRSGVIQSRGNSHHSMSITDVKPTQSREHSGSSDSGEISISVVTSLLCGADATGYGDTRYGVDGRSLRRRSTDCDGGRADRACAPPCVRMDSHNGRVKPFPNPDRLYHLEVRTKSVDRQIVITFSLAT